MSFYNHNSPALRRIVNPWLSLLPAMLLSANAAFALDTGDIVVASTKGEVHFVINGAERALRAGNVLELPATVRTGRDGGVELRQGATSLSVGPDTLLEFPALAQKGGPIDRVVQPRGNVFYNVGKRAGRKLRVETPFLVGVVKGTQFNVVAQDNATTISLFEGLLEVRAADGSDVVDLHAGEIASRDRSAHEISVLRMDSRAPAAPSAPAPSKAPSGASASSSLETPPTPRSAPERGVGELQLAELESRTATTDVAAILGTAHEPDSSTSPRAETRSDVNVPAGDGAAAEVVVVVDTPPIDVAVVDVAVGMPGDNGASVSIDVETAPGGGANVDVSVEAPAASAGADVDLDVGANIDTGNAAPGLDVSADARANSGAAASVDVNSNAQAGPLATGEGAGVAVDLGTEVGAANVDLGVNAQGKGAGVDAGAHVDLGLGNDGNNGNNGVGNGNNGHAVETVSEKVTDSLADSVAAPAVEVVEDVNNLLDSLTRKPGRK